MIEPDTAPAVPTTLYRLYAPDDTLLYVGITKGSAQRLTDHGNQPWWPDVARITFERFSDRAAAATAERHAIATEHPVHNIVGVSHPPKRPKGKVLHVRDFPRGLRGQAKALAIQRRQPLREFVIDAVQREVARLRDARSTT